MQQVGFSLYDYIEMHGQQNIKYRKTVYSRANTIIQGWKKRLVTYGECILIELSFSFLCVVKSARLSRHAV